MFSKRVRWLWATLTILTLVLSACGGADEPAEEGGLQIPDIEEGKFNVALVMLSTHDDGGWSQKDDMQSDAYATGSVLTRLAQTGHLSPSDDEYQRGVQFLLKSQFEDGSWHVASRSKPFQTYFETGFPHGKDQFISTNATAWAVIALLSTLPETESADDPADLRE